LHEERARAHEQGLADHELTREERTSRTETVTEERGTRALGDDAAAHSGAIYEQAPPEGGRPRNGDR
jgi:hypothetical protein